MEIEEFDPCIMLAILRCRREGGSLRDLISEIDYFDHSILTYEMMKGGLDRLGRAGLISEMDGKFVPTKPIADNYTDNALGKKSPMKAVYDVEAFLKNWDSGPAKMRETRGKRGISEKAYDAAVEEHLNRRPRE